MAEISTNGAAVAGDLRAAARKFSVGLERGILAIVIAMERAAAKRLTGGGPPGSYPVPVRTGHLRRSMGHQVRDANEGLVFNTASYAHAIHEGHQPVGHHGRQVIRVTPRRFILDAGDDIDPTVIAEREVGKEMGL